MSWTNNGTLSLTNGSKTVTGVNTYFLANILNGSALVINGAVYGVDTVNSDTQLTLTKNWPNANATGVAYEAFPTENLARETLNKVVELIDTFGPLRSNGTVNLQGKLQTVAGTTGAASLNVPAGVAPSVPSNGDIWGTSAGLFARINGTTQQLAVQSGNVATATKLATARTLSLTGGATGSLTFDGSANASATVTLTSSGITSGLGFTPANKAGDTFSGNVTIGKTGGSKLILSTVNNTAGSVQGIEFWDRFNALEQGPEGQLTGFVRSTRNGSGSEFSLQFGSVNHNANDAVAQWEISGDGNLRPVTTNTYNLGDSTRLVKRVYTARISPQSEGDAVQVDGRLTGGFGAFGSGGVQDWNDASNAVGGSGYTCLLGTHPNGPGPAGYYHPFGFEFLKKDGTGNMTQFAIPYYGGSSYMAFRTRYSGAWDPWRFVLIQDTSGNFLPPTNGSANLGNTSRYFNTVHTNQIATSSILALPKFQSFTGSMYLKADGFHVNYNIAPTGDGSSVGGYSRSIALFGAGPDSLKKMGFGVYGSNTDISYTYWTLDNGTYSSLKGVRMTEAAFYAASDNSMACGDSARRWSTVYAATGTINTSDERLKTWRGGLNDDELAAAKQIISELGFYQWNDAIVEKGADGARYHFGVKAQAVWDIMAENGLIDPIDENGKPGHTPYAFLCYDEWEAQTATVKREPPSDLPEPDAEPTVELSMDEDGTVTETVTEPEAAQVEAAEPDDDEVTILQEAGNRYGVRPDQLTLFLVAAQEQRLIALEDALGS